MQRNVIIQMAGGGLTESLPLPRPLEHGYESVDWSDAPLYKAYGLAGESSPTRHKD